VPAPERRVYVGGLSYDLTEEHIKVPFSSFGQIVMVDMPREPGTNRSKGFCFVEYTTREAAENALNSMSGFTLGGRSIKVGRSTPVGGVSSYSGIPPPSVMALRVAQIREQALTAMRWAEKVTGGAGVRGRDGAASADERSEKPAKLSSHQQAEAKAALARKIYVGQVTETVNADHLKSIFTAFGNVTSVKMSTDGTAGSHKGYGFVEYDSEESANEAVTHMNGFELCGKSLKVTKAIA